MSVVNGEWSMLRPRRNTVKYLSIDPSQFTILQKKPCSDQNPDPPPAEATELNGTQQNATEHNRTQQKLKQGTNVRLIKTLPEYLLIHFLICNFSLPCTPFETPS
jgi:hypothetical protein